MDNCTIIGASGFIGSNLHSFLSAKNINCFCPPRDFNYTSEVKLGVVFYCAGYGDCSNNFLNVVDANLTNIVSLIKNGNFDKLVYVSSTRLYMNSELSTESSDLIIGNDDNRKLFNITKLAAEEICRISNKNIVVVRPSNVYGLAINSPLFLPKIIKNAINNKHVDMFVDPTYSKDYVSVSDVVELMYKLAFSKNNIEGVYNIASGYNINAQSIADILIKETGCTVQWHENSTKEEFPVIDMTKTNKIIPHNYRDMLDDLRDMISKFKSSGGV